MVEESVEHKQLRPLVIDLFKKNVECLQQPTWICFTKEQESIVSPYVENAKYLGLEVRWGEQMSMGNGYGSSGAVDGVAQPWIPFKGKRIDKD